MQTGPAREVGANVGPDTSSLSTAGKSGCQRGSSSTRAVRQGPGGSLASLVRARAHCSGKPGTGGGTGGRHLPGCPSLAPCAVPLSLRNGHGDGSPPGASPWPGPLGVAQRFCLVQRGPQASSEPGSGSQLPDFSRDWPGRANRPLAPRPWDLVS